MAEWLEDHMTVIGSLNLNCGLVGRTWYVESGDRQSGRRRSGMWKVGTSKVVAPACVG
jgi:hypothetical protein